MLAVLLIYVCMYIEMKRWKQGIPDKLSENASSVYLAFNVYILYQGFVQGGGRPGISPQNPFSIDIIWLNYNKIHLFYNIIQKIHAPRPPYVLRLPPKPKILYESLYMQMYFSVHPQITVIFLVICMCDKYGS